MEQHKLVVCHRCCDVFVTRGGATGCACSGAISQIHAADSSAYMEAVKAYNAVDLRHAIATAKGRPLALHGQWMRATQSLVDAGVAKVVGVGDIVRVIVDAHTNSWQSMYCTGMVVGVSNDGMKLIVDFSDGTGDRTGSYIAGTDRWDLCIV